MATLLYQIRPRMQKSIVEAEDHFEKRVVYQTEQKIQAVHQRLYAFNMRVLECPASPPPIDLTTFKKAVASLQANVDSILEMRGTDLETPHPSS